MKDSTPVLLGAGAVLLMMMGGKKKRPKDEGQKEELKEDQKELPEDQKELPEDPASTEPEAGVVMYSKASCGECDALEQYLLEHDIDYVRKDIANPAVLNEMKSFATSKGLTGQISMPISNVDGDLIVGFDEGVWDAALEIDADLPPSDEERCEEFIEAVFDGDSPSFIRQVVIDQAVVPHMAEIADDVIAAYNDAVLIRAEMARSAMNEIAPNCGWALSDSGAGIPALVYLDGQPLPDDRYLAIYNSLFKIADDLLSAGSGLASATGAQTQAPGGTQTQATGGVAQFKDPQQQ